LLGLQPLEKHERALLVLVRYEAKRERRHYDCSRKSNPEKRERPVHACTWKKKKKITPERMEASSSTYRELRSAKKRRKNAQMHGTNGQRKKMRSARWEKGKKAKGVLFRPTDDQCRRLGSRANQTGENGKEDETNARPTDGEKEIRNLMEKEEGGINTLDSFPNQSATVQERRKIVLQHDPESEEGKKKTAGRRKSKEHIKPCR